MQTRKALLSLVLTLLIPVSVGAEWRKENNKAQEDDIASRRAWSHEFPQKVMQMEALPGTYLAVTTAGKKKQGRGLWLLDGRTGEVIWQGSAEDTHIVAGEPHPILVQQEKGRLTLTALDRFGKTVWTRPFDLVSISLAVDLSRKELTLFGAKGMWWEGSPEQEGTIMVVSAESGETLRERSLGSFTLPKAVPSTAMEVTEGSIWIAAGGRALKLSRENLLSSFDQPFPDVSNKKGPAVPHWDAEEDRAALALDNQVFLFDALQGLVWSSEMKNKKIIPGTVVLDDKAVVVEFRWPHRERSGLVIASFDRNTGNLLWEHEGRDGIFAKWDRAVAAPEGIAVGSGKVVFAIGEKWLWLDVLTGEVVRKDELSTPEYRYAVRTERRGDLVLLTGKYELRAHNLQTGELVWHLEEIGSPKDFGELNLKLVAGLQAIGAQFKADLAASQAASFQSLANVKVAGKSGSHYSHYVLSPSARGQILSMAHQAERDNAWAKVSLASSKIQQKSPWIEEISYPGDRPLLVRPRVMNTNRLTIGTPFTKTSLILVDVPTGQVAADVPMPDAKMGCLSAMTADIPGGMVYHSHHKLALACKGAKSIQGYRLPEAAASVASGR